MINQKQMIFSLICLYTLANTPVALCDTLPVIYVAGDGTGNFNCNGTNDQVQINQALEYAANHTGTTVYLKGPFVYDIECSCLIGSNTELTGDLTAKLRLHDNIGWTTASAGTPMVGQIGGYGTAVHDISIHGFEIDGNEMNQSSGGLSDNGGGHDLYRIISFQGSSNKAVKNISCYNMNLRDSKGDGFRVKYGTNITAYGNTLSNLQHCCIFFYDVNTGSIHNNADNELCCSGVRLDDCQNIIVDSDAITPYTGSTNYPKDSLGNGYDDNGIQIANSDSTNTSNVIIKNCTIKGGVNAILLEYLNDNCIVNIYKNTIHDSGYENEAVTRNGGIGITGCGNGITIQYNSITGSYTAGINVYSSVSSKLVTVANNDVMNGKTGYAVKNSIASNVNLILTHNYIYDNPANFYPSSLVNTNPATSPNIPVLPIASFTASTTSGTTTSPITFTDTTNTPTSWSWNFGDSSALATTKNVSHTFSEAGTYTITLTVKNAVGSTSTSKTITIAATPVASFTVSPTSGETTTTTYTFTDTSTNTPTIWTWNFGDGGTGSGKNVTHKYTTAKTYTVTLTAGNTAGNATATKSVVVIAVVKPVASFTVSPTSGGTITTTYTFTDTSTNTPTIWTWNFGDGGTGSGKNVTHKYTTAKTYTVTLTAGNTAGKATATKSVVVIAVVKPVASFTVSPTSGGTTTTTYTFTDTSTNTPTIWTWNFGDGGTGSGKSVTHKYTTAKTYTVTLTAGNTAGKATATKSVTVSASNPTKSPVASFTYSPTAVKKGVTIKFADTSTNMPNTWKWTFGDGSAVVTSQNPTHVFSKTGSFKISLAVYNKVGSNSATKFITVS